MHFCRPTFQNIEDVECDWFQENQAPSFPNSLSAGNNNEHSTANNNESTVFQKEDTSTAPNQEVNTVEDDKAHEEVSPKRAKLR